MSYPSGQTDYFYWQRILIDMHGEYGYAQGDTTLTMIRKIAWNLGAEIYPNDNAISILRAITAKLQGEMPSADASLSQKLYRIAIGTGVERAAPNEKPRTLMWKIANKGVIGFDPDDFEIFETSDNEDFYTSMHNEFLVQKE